MIYEQALRTNCLDISWVLERWSGVRMTDLDNVDFFTDSSVVENPYPYFEHIRGKCPAFR
jgi:hypothetical protein